MKRSIARREDEPMYPTALEVAGKLLCYPCLVAGRTTELRMVQEIRLVNEALIAPSGGVALIKQRRLFIGFTCPVQGCLNATAILEAEKVYLERAQGFALPQEE